MAPLIVVDDEAVIAEILAAALSDEGHFVITASHGIHALKRLEEYPNARLVISDFMMPALDGAGLLRAMRVCPVHHKTPFILMSAMPEHHIRQHTQGYAAFISKPFDVEKVIALVADVLGAGSHSVH